MPPLRRPPAGASSGAGKSPTDTTGIPATTRLLPGIAASENLVSARPGVEQTVAVAEVRKRVAEEYHPEARRQNACEPPACSGRGDSSRTPHPGRRQTKKTRDRRGS